MAISRIEQLLAPALVEGLDEVPMAELRSRRAEVQDAADALSYLRRLAQGRLDLVERALAAREGGERPELGSIVEELKRGEILAEGTRGPGGGLGRLPQSMSPAEADGWITEELDEVLGPAQLGRLPELPLAELQEIADQLRAIERRVSDQRTTLHQRADRLQEEIVRRYKTGEASVDSLLG